MNKMDVFNDNRKKINKLCSQIKHYREQYLLQFPLESRELEILTKKFREEEVFASNHIEGNSYTLNDTRFLLETGIAVSGKKLKDGLEIVNINNGIKLLETCNKEVTESLIKTVHEIVTKGTLDSLEEEKEYKQVKNYIGEIQTSSVAHTPIHMKKLVEDLKTSLTSLDIGDTKIIPIITKFKFLFLIIHPFVDGNGRTIRLLYNYLLTKYDFVPISILPEDKEEYYKVLQNSSKENTEELLIFMCKMIIKSYQRRLDWLNEE